MKHLIHFNDFVLENRKNKPNIKKKVKKINKVINKQYDKIEKETARAKELASKPDVTDKMSATLSRMKVQLAQAEAQKQAVRKNVEIKKAQIRTAKDQAKSGNELEKKAKETKKEEADK